MATASHEQLPGLPASMQTKSLQTKSLSAKSPHRAPISDLWSTPLGPRARSTERADYAREIALDNSRGPLMSSASSSVHDGLDEAHAPSHPTTQTSQSGHPTGTMTSSVTPHSLSKDGTPTNGAPLTPTSSLWPSAGSSAVQIPGVPLTAAAVGAQGVRSVSSVGSGQMAASSRFWGPRQSFSGFTAKPSFVPSSSGSNNAAVYGGASSWAIDSASNPGAPAGVSPAALGMHGLASSNGVAAPAYFAPGVGSAMGPHAMTPSPSPPHSGGMAAMGARLYSPQSAASHGASVVPAVHPTSHSNAHPHAHPTAHPNAHPSAHPNTHPNAHASAVHGGAPNAGASHAHGGVAPHGHPQLAQHPPRGQFGQDHSSYMRPFKKNGRPSTNTELYKTELCASYMSTGGNCPYGEKCQFAHGPQELKTVDRPPKWRSKPCQNWVRTGTCSYNERCCFRHDVPVGYDQQE